VLDRSADAEPQAAIRHEYALHFPQCRHWIGEELRGLLTKDDVEGAAWKRELLGVALLPSDLNTLCLRCRPRDGKHPLVEIESRNGTGRDTPRRPARDDARATRDIEYALGRLKLDKVNEALSRILHERRNQIALVGIRAILLQLPTTLLRTLIEHITLLTLAHLLGRFLLLSSSVRGRRALRMRADT
jgi:hypothetical protein